MWEHECTVPKERSDVEVAEPRSSGSSPEASVPRGAVWIVFLVFAVSWLAGLGAWDLQEPDEGRYSDVAAAMVRTGHWLVPELNGIGYYSKPPLAFWASAAGVQLFGPVEWAVRLPSVLAGLATLLVVHHWARRARGASAALLSVLLLGSTPLFAVLSGVVLVDGLLTTWITLATYAGYRAVVRETGSASATADREFAQAPRGATLLFWISCGLAFLTKGPIGVVLPVAAVGTYCLAVRDLRRGLVLLRPLDLVVFVAIAAPWYVAVCWVHPEYFQKFFVEQNLERFTTGAQFRRQKPFWFYVPVLLLTALPWSLCLPMAVRDAGRRSLLGREESLGKYLAITLVTWFAILSVAQSKLPYYLMPLLPLVALGLGSWLQARITAAKARTEGAVNGALLASAALFVLVVLLGSYAAFRPDADLFQALVERMPPRNGARLEQFLEHSVIATTLGSAGLAIGLWLAWRNRRRGSPRRALALAGFALTALLSAVPFALGGLRSVLSVRPLADAVRALRHDGEPVLAYGRFPRGLPFYLQEEIALWDARSGEFGQVLEPGAMDGRCLQKDRTLLRAMIEEHDGVLLIGDEREDLEDFSSESGYGFEVIHEQGDWLLARTRKELAIPGWAAPVDEEQGDATEDGESD